jgi:hypothetical protein
VIYLYFERLQAWLNRSKPARAPLDASHPRSA